MPAWDTWLHCNAIAWLEGLYCGTDGRDYARGFVAKYHGGFEDEAANTAMQPVMDLLNRLIQSGTYRASQRRVLTSLPQIPVQATWTITS